MKDDSILILVKFKMLARLENYENNEKIEGVFLRNAINIVSIHYSKYLVARVEAQCVGQSVVNIQNVEMSALVVSPEFMGSIKNIRAWCLTQTYCKCIHAVKNQ